MRLRFLGLVLGLLVFAWPAFEARANGLAQAGQEVKKGADAVEDAGEATGHAVKKGTLKTAHVAKKNAKVVGEKTEDAGEATGHAVKKGVKKTGSAVKKATTDQ